MKPHKILTLISLMTIAISSFAQDETDALRYSMLSPMGTARSIGFGGALGSVGGDFTSLSVNPAGLGIYRRSEFMFTPSLKMNNVNSKYLGMEYDQSAARLNFNNIGLVMTWAERGKRYENSKWKTMSFAIGYNRLAEFKREYVLQGQLKDPFGNNGSFSELFVADARNHPSNVNSEGTMAYIGYQSYLVNQDSLGYFTLADVKTGLNQLKTVEEKGGVNELCLSFGGNYEEKIMFGATLGLPSIRYIRHLTFDEADASNNDSNYFSYFRYKEDLKTTGNGVNLKLGVIVKPIDALRLGIAIHTPTIFTITDVSNTSIETNTESFKSVIGASDTNPITNVTSPEQRFTYTLITPWRAVFSGTGFIGKLGFVSVDYEYVNYKSMRYHFEQEFAEDARLRNNVIKNTYKAAHNLRIGAEIKMDDFFFRGGVGIYGSPFQNANAKFMRKDFSFGLGYRSGDFFTDVAFVHSDVETTEKPYSLPTLLSPTANLTSNFNTISWTFGWKL